MVSSYTQLLRKRYGAQLDEDADELAPADTSTAADAEPQEDEPAEEELEPATMPPAVAASASADAVAASPASGGSKVGPVIAALIVIGALLAIFVF